LRIITVNYSADEHTIRMIYNVQFISALMSACP